MKASLSHETEGKTVRVGIYIRKSRKDKEGGAHRLTVQREQLPAYARTQPGWQYQIYDDDFASAARGKTDDLRERARLKNDICSGKIDVVLCIELSRLSRDESLQDYVALLDLCAKHGVRLATIGRMLDPCQMSDWMLLLMEGGFSSVEMKTIMRRMEEGRRQAYQDGKWLGGHVPPPYRYDHNLGKPVIDESLLVQTRHLWTLAETMSAKAVAKQLGMPEITVRRAISDNRLLFYQGLRADNETGEMIRCDWDPVMDTEQAARIRAARRSRKSYAKRCHPAALLSNMNVAYCGYCGRTIKVWHNTKSRIDGHRIDYYGCQSKSEKGSCNASRMMKQHDLDSRVVTNLMGTLQCLDALKEFWLAEQERNDPKDDLRRVEEKEAQLAKRKGNIIDSIAEGIISADDAKQKLAEINNGLSDAAAERSTILLQACEADAPDWECLSLTGEEFAMLDLDDKRALIKAAVERIDVYGNYAFITYRFPRRPNGDRTARIHLPPPARRPKHNRRRTKRGKPEEEAP